MVSRGNMLGGYVEPLTHLAVILSAVGGTAAAGWGIAVGTLGMCSQQSKSSMYEMTTDLTLACSGWGYYRTGVESHLVGSGPLHHSTLVLRHSVTTTAKTRGLSSALNTKQPAATRPLPQVVHDFEHAGRTNDFLITSAHTLAVRYNDRAPMENHHVAAAFEALRTPGMDCLSHLCKADYDTVRKLVGEGPCLVGW